MRTQNLEDNMRRGARGPAPAWNLGRTRSIRVPIVLAETLLEIARQLDKGQSPVSVTLNDIKSTGASIAELKKHSTSTFERKVQRELITKGMRYDLLKAAGFRCQACGASASTVELQVDHIIPIAKGGTSKQDNLQILCRDCNSGKSDRL